MSGLRLSCVSVVLCVVVTIVVCVPQPARAAFITGPGDQFTTGIGDYLDVAGLTQSTASSPGQVLEIVGGSGGSDLKQLGTEMATLFWGDVQTTLSGSLSSTSLLVFGFSVNQNGPFDTLTLTQIDLDTNNDGTVDFSLAADTIQIVDFNNGTSTAEARIAVDVGFDVFTKGSLDQLKMTVSQSGDTGGFETLFLSETFTAFPDPPIGGTTVVPGPPSAVLFGIGGVLLSLRYCRRRPRVGRQETPAV